MCRLLRDEEKRVEAKARNEKNLLKVQDLSWSVVGERRKDLACKI